jgi:hypothetical protein
MKEISILDQPTSAGPTPSAHPNLPRLRLPFISLLIFWGVTFAAGAVDKPYFFGFLYSLLSTSIITLLLLGWWWFNRAIRFREKLIGFAIVLGEAMVV